MTDELTHLDFLAVLVNMLYDPEEATKMFPWLCLNETEKQAQLDRAVLWFENWKMVELRIQEARRAGVTCTMKGGG